MDQDQEDPFDWSVDQVVQYLCRNESTPWSASKNPSPLPERTHLEAALREHGITGEVLLNGRLDDFLRNSLKLKEGPYYTVNKAIQYAQRLSPKFQAVQTQERSQFASAMLPMMMSNDRAWPYPFNAPWMFNPTPASSHISQTTPAQNTLITANDVDTLPNEQLLANLQAAQLSSPRVAEADDVELPDASTETGNENGRQLFRGSSPSLRPNEAIHVDEHGRKRRRLDLTSIEPKPPKKLATPEEGAVVPTRTPESWYMGPARIDIANVFYPIQPNSHVDNWSFSSSHHSVGQRLFVKRKIFNFFRKRAILLPSQKGARRSAVFPYDEDEANRGKPRYYTLYTSHNGRTEVIMRSTADSDHDLDLTADKSSRTQTASPYDYLLQKYPVKEGDEGEDSYPVFGESGSEGEYDSDTWREIDDEREQAALRASKCLSVQQVDLTIDQCIKKFEEKWKIKHLPKLELEAHNLWLEALRTRSRNSRIKIMWDSIERLNLRLGKIRKELHGHEWMQRVHLENQCESMKQTVFELEATKQRIAILELPGCPPKPPSAPRVAAKPKKKAIQNPLEEEESLESDSDDGSLGDFIVDDMDLDDTITNAAPNDGRNVVTQTNTITDSSTLSDSNDHHSRPDPTPKDVIREQAVNKAQPHSEKATSQRRLGLYYSSESDSDGYSPQPTLNPSGQDIEVIDLTISPGRSSKSSVRPSNPPTKSVGHDDVMVVIPSIEKPRSSFIPDTTTQNPDSNRVHSGKFKDKKKIDFSPVRHQRRIELLETMIEGLPENSRLAMVDRLCTFSEKKLKHFVKGALAALNKDRRRVPGMNHDDSDLVMRVTVLYVGWVNLLQFNSSGIAKTAIKKTIGNIEDRESNTNVNFSEYVSQLFTVLEGYNSKPTSPSTGDSDDDRPRTPHIKRKKRVKEDQAVKSGQAAAKQRVELQEIQRKRLEQRLERVGVSNSDPEHQAVSFEQPTIFLHPHIGRRVKPHQLAGIQFMWREIIQNEKRDGCLLAHTMGLGKTMQV